MKVKILVLLISIVLVSGCEKASYKNAATITERDYRKCMCCGGYFVEINSIQYNFEKSELPVNFTFNDTQLPLQVELDFEMKTDDCSDSGVKWIHILNIRKKK